MGSGKTPVPVTDGCIEASPGRGETEGDIFSSSQIPPPATSKTLQEERKRLWGHPMARNVREVDPISSEDAPASPPSTHKAQPPEN